MALPVQFCVFIGFFNRFGGLVLTLAAQINCDRNRAIRVQGIGAGVSDSYWPGPISPVFISAASFVNRRRIREAASLHCSLH